MDWVAPLVKWLRAVIVTAFLGILGAIYTILAEEDAWTSAVGFAFGKERIKAFAQASLSGQYDRIGRWIVFGIFLAICFAWLVEPLHEAIRRVRTPSRYWTDRRLRKALQQLHQEISGFLRDRESHYPSRLDDLFFREGNTSNVHIGHGRDALVVGPGANENVVRLARNALAERESYEKDTVQQFDSRFAGQTIAALTEAQARGLIIDAEEIKIVRSYLQRINPGQAADLYQRSARLIATCASRLNG